MFQFLKKTKPGKDINSNSELLLKTAALLIHAAKIDEKYSINEKELIKKALIELGIDVSKIDKTISNAEIYEKNSNQIIDFTKVIKNSDIKFKIKVVETLWTIIYSDNNADMYESNLMRRLSGLLYIEDKIIGEIKEKIKSRLSK